jgi:hypothetical protein
VDALEGIIRIFSQVKKQPLREWFECSFTRDLACDFAPHSNQGRQLVGRHEVIQPAIGMPRDAVHILAAAARHYGRYATMYGTRYNPHGLLLGKDSKIRYVPLRSAAASAIVAFLEAAGHGDDKAAPLFYAVSVYAPGPGRQITPDGLAGL